MLNHPPQLFRGHKYFPQTRIHHRLARIQAGYTRNRLLVLQHKFEYRLEYFSALGKGGLRPLRLGFGGFGDRAVDGGGA